MSPHTLGCISKTQSCYWHGGLWRVVRGPRLHFIHSFTHRANYRIYVIDTVLRTYGFSTDHSLLYCVQCTTYTSKLLLGIFFIAGSALGRVVTRELQRSVAPCVSKEYPSRSAIGAAAGRAAAGGAGDGGSARLTGRPCGLTVTDRTRPSTRPQSWYVHDPIVATKRKVPAVVRNLTPSSSASPPTTPCTLGTKVPLAQTT